MKVFIVILVVTAMVVQANSSSHEHGHQYTVKTHEDLIKFRNECSAELKVPAEMVEKYKKWEYPDDHVTHCYMKCMFEHFGFFDEQNGFDVHKIHHQLMGDNHEIDHNDETHQKIEKCADKNTEGTDACAWAYRGGVCFIKNNLHLVKQSVAAH